MKTEDLKTMKIQDLTITTGTAEILDFGEQVENVEDIAVGMSAKILADPLAGTPEKIPEGDYVMITGAIWSFSKGTLTKMGAPTQDLKAGGQRKVSGLILKGHLLLYATKKNRTPGIPSNRFARIKPKIKNLTPGISKNRFAGNIPK